MQGLGGKGVFAQLAAVEERASAEVKVVIVDPRSSATYSSLKQTIQGVMTTGQHGIATGEYHEIVLKCMGVADQYINCFELSDEEDGRECLSLKLRYKGDQSLSCVFIKDKDHNSLFSKYFK